MFRKNRAFRHKNRILVRQIADALKYKERYRNSLTPEPSSPTPSPSRGGKGSIYNHRGEPTEELTTPLPIAGGAGGGAGGGGGEALSDEQLFQHINAIIVREKLFLDPKFERQTIMDRFQLSKERVGAVFSKGSEHAKLNTYIQQLRLEYAAQQLIEQPFKSIVQIAADSGFGSNAYFANCFRQRYGMNPSTFRQTSSEREKA